MLVVIYVDVQKEYNKNVLKKVSINRSKKQKRGGGTGKSWRMEWITQGEVG